LKLKQVDLTGGKEIIKGRPISPPFSLSASVIREGEQNEEGMTRWKAPEINL